MPVKPPSLWRRFATIAQPYFFPHVRMGGWITLMLMALLMAFLFGVLCVAVAGMVAAGNAFFPELTGRIAGGLVALVQNLFHSGGWLLIASALAVPLLIFSGFRRHLAARRRAWTLLAIVLLLSLSVTGINVAFSYIGNYFTNSLVKKNQEMAYLYVAVYFGGFLIGIPIVAFYGYMRDYLGMHWREWMTGEFVGNYFKNRNYYEIEADGSIDNPDQRIMEDIRSFTRTSLAFLLILLGSLMDLISFTGILWSKSRLLVGVVLVYSIAGTLLTALIGRRLVRLNFNQLRYEADFRYALVHVRDNAESIAFYQGEGPEAQQIGSRFHNVLRNFSLLIGWQRNLSFFTTAYSYLPAVLPFLILFGPYFSGKIEYGDMVQANFAFTQVYGAMSLIVSQIESITSFAAGVKRLSTFAEAIPPDRPPMDGIRSEDADHFALDRMTLMTPDNRRNLIRNLSLALDRKLNLVVVGPSGVGKSSLLRAIAGLWTRGGGIVRRPPLERIFFLPQKPYMLLGSLRDQLRYPRLQEAIPDDELQRVLEMVNLKDLPARMGGFDEAPDWADLLSLGEQQRLAFGRLLIHRPAFAVLDEATSALDRSNESRLYGLLREMGIHYISVGHRESLLDYHDRVLELKGEARWRMVPVPEYREPITAT
ncbi:ABC transporter ATP-binding protein/permease [Desulfosarcina ovata]|uniref:ABC transporter ATP-binding protein n=1 Tax=Desulfosarcina ovata subsp. ovata TaxID=2752305 RepID=A0A5K8AKW1_9BACT|nr:ABC transporter ATP-binding protein/permease [Desulfosarcina ovata]BBO93238.1 ABC transporter ATP-binding protein [Desulfosarcina ovata subsp. ovata]